MSVTKSPRFLGSGTATDVAVMSGGVLGVGSPGVGRLGALVISFNGYGFELSCADTKVPLDTASETRTKIIRKCETLVETNFGPPIGYIKAIKKTTNIIAGVRFISAVIKHLKKLQRFPDESATNLVD